GRVTAPPAWCAARPCSRPRPGLRRRIPPACPDPRRPSGPAAAATGLAGAAVHRRAGAGGRSLGVGPPLAAWPGPSPPPGRATAGKPRVVAPCGSRRHDGRSKRQRHWQSAGGELPCPWVDLCNRGFDTHTAPLQLFTPYLSTVYRSFRRSFEKVSAECQTDSRKSHAIRNLGAVPWKVRSTKPQSRCLGPAAGEDPKPRDLPFQHHVSKHPEVIG